MAGTCVQLLPLCSTPRLATRDGLTGANAYLNLVGLGIWFASGQTLTFRNDRQVQDRERTYVGTVKPDTYSKGFACNVPGTCPA